MVMAAGWIANHCEGPLILASFGIRGMIPLGMAPGWRRVSYNSVSPLQKIAQDRTWP
jgi:hypothetical protein